MAFPENLQFLRAQNSVTQEQLAEQLGVSRQSVSKWESGNSFPEMETLLRICDLYSVNLDALLRGSLEERLVSDTAQYNAFMDRFSLRMAGAIGAILAAVGTMILLSVLGVSEILSVAFLLLVITVSTVVMVASGMEHDHFRKKHPVIQDFYSEEEKEAFHHRFIWLIAGGVGAILFGVVLLVGAFAFLPEREPYESLVSGLFLFIVAGAVSAFTYAGLQDDKYKIWKYNRDNNPTPEAKRRLDQIGTGCTCAMLLCTAIYVSLSLYGGEWERNVWLFAAGGILCAIISVILNPYKGEDD